MTPEAQRLNELNQAYSLLMADVQQTEKGSKRRRQLIAEQMAMAAEITQVKAIVRQQNRESTEIARQETINFLTLRHEDGRITGHVAIASPGEVQTQLCLIRPGWYIVFCAKLTDEQADQLPPQFDELPTP